MIHNIKANEELIRKIFALIPEYNIEYMLEDPLIVKSSPHKLILKCRGYLKSKWGKLYLIPYVGEWIIADFSDPDMGYILQSLLQRIIK